tara:strand:+ start:2270 stop:2962 length:693 start_codon:yes stop_codon:yes gene_type:complete
MDDLLKTIDCHNKLSAQSILDALNVDGICILKNYFHQEQISIFEKEVDRIFIEKLDEIDILDKEGCSKDKRIFGAQKYSNFINQNFNNNELFKFISYSYTGRVGERKTLINLLEHEDGKIKNSGAGWHRDNHDCQFKVIMYLTDVDTSLGNFQWITNSNKIRIGYPTPRTTSYNTRYSDEVIKALLINPHCDLVDITGPAGTIIFVDTTFIHRGKIIEQGIRKAMTQYFF